MYSKQQIRIQIESALFVYLRIYAFIYIFILESLPVCLIKIKTYIHIMIGMPWDTTTKSLLEKKPSMRSICLFIYPWNCVFRVMEATGWFMFWGKELN